MYGLKQAARLAYDELVANLAKHGYKPDPISPNIWSHTDRPTKFCLCVDDFGIKYHSQEDANHLITALKTNYEITIDTEGNNFCGLNLLWDYKQGHVDVSMQHYVIKALHKLQHAFPSKPQYAPHKWTVPIYGKNRQFAPDPDTNQLLPPKGIKKVQRTVGTFLYYGRAIDNTILPALNDITSSQPRPRKQ